MNIFRKKTEITFLIKKDIENNKPYHNAIFDRVDEASCNTPQDTKDRIMMIICDELDKKVIKDRKLSEIEEYHNIYIK